MARDPNPPTAAELFGIVSEGLDEAIHHPNRYGYTPYPEQQRFHECELIGRYISGGNRGGKSDAEVMEAIWWATDSHPYLERPEEWGKGPLEIRFVVVDVSKGVEQIILPKLKRWLAPSDLIGGSWDKSWNGKDMILTLSNGAIIDFVTWGMDSKKLGGVPRHIIFFDEVPPQHIFNECLMRLLDYRGRWVIAGTPLDGMAWAYDLIWEPAKIAGDDAKVGTFQLSAAQNPFLKTDDEQRDEYMIGMSEEERRIRESGDFVARSGLVFPEFSQHPEKFVVTVSPADLKDWVWWFSIDSGWNNPTAILWHAVSPKGRIITFAEHYASKMTVAEHAAIVKEKERNWGKEPEFRTGDPALKQTRETTGTSVIGEYAKRGIYIGVENVPRDVMVGIERMQQYMRVRGEHPTWQVSSNCPNLIRELKKLRWATYSSETMAYALNKQEVIHKKDDHASDSLRYFMTLQPELASDFSAPALGDKPTTVRFADIMSQLSNDPNVNFAESASPMWDTVEAYTEGY